jgi:Fe-S-cluster containining protein
MDLRQIVFDASRRADVLDAVGMIYADLMTAIENRQPKCSASGACCRFEAYGHRLYVSTMELAAFVASIDRGPVENWDGTGCPYQVAGRCGVHPVRPFGCRIYFCDPTSTAWQNQLYEVTHQRLKVEHEQLGVPYRYIEWRAALAELGLTGSDRATGVSANLNAFDIARARSVHLPQVR